MRHQSIELATLKSEKQEALLEQGYTLHSTYVHQSTNHMGTIDQTPMGVFVKNARGDWRNNLMHHTEVERLLGDIVERLHTLCKETEGVSTSIDDLANSKSW